MPIRSPTDCLQHIIFLPWPTTSRSYRSQRSVLSSPSFSLASNNRLHFVQAFSVATTFLPQPHHFLPLSLKTTKPSTFLTHSLWSSQYTAKDLHFWNILSYSCSALTSSSRLAFSLLCRTSLTIIFHTDRHVRLSKQSSTWAFRHVARATASSIQTRRVCANLLTNPR